MGAGLSGLSCARILEQNNIKPDIFEKKSQPGDRFLNCEILLPLLTKPINDPIKYFSEEYNLHLKPQHNISKLIIHSEKEKAEIKGHLGFTNLRGRTQNSFEKQLAGQIKSNIFYNSKKSYEELLQKYTHVILATGDAAYAKKLQDYKIDLTVTLKGAIIKGSFNPGTVEAWLNNKLAPRGYGYLIPLSHEKANIVIGFPDHKKKPDINSLWEKFKAEISAYLSQELTLKNHFEINDYIIGLCKYPRLGNTFFVGNNFGSIMPFLGFGQVASLLTGIYAALDICGKGNYEELTSQLKKSYNDSLALRKTLEQLNNHKYDLLVKSLSGKTGQKIMQNMVDSNKNYLKIISNLLKPFVG